MRPALGFRPYRHGDADQIDARADFAAEQAAMGWPLRQARPRGEAWTITRDGQPIGCGGVAYDRQDKVWRGWLYLSDLSRREWAHALRTSKHALDYVDQHAGVSIEASAMFENKAALRTLHRLGFVFERGGFTHGDEPYVQFLREAA
ncbi:hypothetical protein [Caulobacter sp. S45]|uniref:hypothetical protein n=1 Tax=Caulobacter sp. S45 TaxID=1641861 RepID=UPI001576C07E|nr:hypothetical protein [Caulobacter sp. S45]